MLAWIILWECFTWNTILSTIPLEPQLTNWYSILIYGFQVSVTICITCAHCFTWNNVLSWYSQAHDLLDQHELKHNRLACPSIQITHNLMFVIDLHWRECFTWYNYMNIKSLLYRLTMICLILSMTTAWLQLFMFHVKHKGEVIV